MWKGRGRLEFRRPRWEDMPTQYQVVNGLADLEPLEFLEATITHTVGSKDLSDQRILE